MKNSPMVFAIACLSLAAIGQSQNNAAFYNSFDKTLQVKNAAFNNGKIHFNPYRSIDKTFRYYIASDFIDGQIIFDGQWYGNLGLKYDLLKDELIVKFDGKGNKMGFSPVKNRTQAFFIGGVKFSNLDLVPHPDFVAGFYEETDAGTVRLYTKYTKNQFASLTNEAVFYTYVQRNDFILQHQNSFVRIDNERDVIKAFPQFETAIAEFFRANAPLEKTDRSQFMKKLIFYLDQQLNREAK